MSESIAVGVIGVGEYGSNHARQLKEVESAELVGVYDLNPDRARALAAELGVRAFESLDELLGAVQAASVVIPTALHAETAYFLKCIDENKKPFNDGVAGLRVVRILEAAEKSVRNRGEAMRIVTIISITAGR